MRRTSIHGLAVLSSAAIATGVTCVAPVDTSASRSAQSGRAVQALLVSEYANGAAQRASIVSLDGKELPVPVRLRTLPWAVWRLSPDARFVAQVRPGTVVRRGSVLVGRVRGGAMQTVLEEPCPTACAIDPTYAWSPDSRRLAIAAGGPGEPTVLRLFDVSGLSVGSFQLPRTDPDDGGKATHRVISWSPDGSRLLLMRVSENGSSTAVVLDIGTGAWRSVAAFMACDGPALEWSPDGRLIALDSRGTQDCLDLFAIIDVVHGKTLTSRHWDKGLGQGGTLWAPDGRSVFGTATTYRSGRYLHRIDRIYLSGRRVNVVAPAADASTPRAALATGLTYDTANALYLRRLATGETDRLMSLRSSLITVEPLRRLT